VRKTIIGCLGIVAVTAAVGCSQRNASSSESLMNPLSPTSSTLDASTGGTVKETLTGPAIGGVVPEGQALADESQYLSGGSTILTVQVKKVNLADGTVLKVSLDGTPVGSITLAKNEGTMRADLGHFAVSRDQVRVLNSNFVVILSGGFFQ
jgi:hypothetical protein